MEILIKETLMSFHLFNCSCDFSQAYVPYERPIILCEVERALEPQFHSDCLLQTFQCPGGHRSQALVQYGRVLSLEET